MSSMRPPMEVRRSVAIHEDPGPIGQGQNDARYASVPFLPTDEGLPRLVEASMAAARGTTTGIMTIAVRPAVARASRRPIHLS